MTVWTPDSWRKFQAKQQPEYPDAKKVADVEARLKKMPPLVFAGEIRKLKQRLAQAAVGEAVILQGGDCAESFAEFDPKNIRDTFRVFLQMAMVFAYTAGKPVIKIGRIAGQFAKPRSSPMEKKGDIELPSYRGDIINSMEFTKEARVPDPERLVQAYNQSAATLNLLRAFAHGGYGSIARVQKWMLDFVANSPAAERYKKISERVEEAITFMNACGVNTDNTPQLSEVDFYTSHEALLLGYEEAFTRVDSTTGDPYDCSAHFLWIGDRTRDPNDAHVEFLRGVKNPIGIKCGPTLETDGLMRLLDTLNPDNEPGRITLISRMGDGNVEKHLPPLLRKVKQSGHVVTWISDPMHGNTQTATTGYKTRDLKKIMNELKQFFQACTAESVYAAGVHIEMTGRDVTECIGGPQDISDENLADRYHTHCDPRLNASQALELAFSVGEMLQQELAQMKAIKVA